MRQAFPKAIFSGDIGCYTLGTSQGAVDTCVDMGGSVGLAAGFYEAFHQDGPLVPIIASIGDSTFFHAALPLLYDSVRKGKQYILVIMDNGTTAMTGMQPTPQSGDRAEGASDYAIPIEEAVLGFGVEFLRVLDPYDIPGMIKTVKEAGADLKQRGKGPAVILARHPCVLYAKTKKNMSAEPPDLAADCNGCKRCVELYGCPAFLFDESERRLELDDALCINCGTCLFVCPQKKARRAGSEPQVEEMN
jgi:indolepyruvate ferredoxin oxidoreductase alpha subunit